MGGKLLCCVFVFFVTADAFKFRLPVDHYHRIDRISVPVVPFEPVTAKVTEATPSTVEPQKDIIPAREYIDKTSESSNKSQDDDDDDNDEDYTGPPVTIDYGMNDCATSDTGYIFFKKQLSCYKIHKEGRSWFDAKATCEREGAYLAIINNLPEQDILLQLYPEGFRVVHMGHRKSDLNYWATIHGQTMYNEGYGKWVKDVRGNQICVAMFPDGTFDDIDCKDETAFICERDYVIIQIGGAITTEANKVNNKDTGYTYYRSTQSCYKVHTDIATWQDAEDTCIKEGGHLAIINSRDEADILMKQYPKEYGVVYLGFQKMGVWMTMNELILSGTDYVKFAEGEPNHLAENQRCGAMYPDGTFVDVVCIEENAYVCEKDYSRFLYKLSITSSTSTVVSAKDGEDDATEHSSTVSLLPERATSTESQNTFDTTDTDVMVKDPTSTETSTMPAYPENKCQTADEGYTFYKSTESCYKVHTKPASWQDAKTTCQREGGHLVLITKESETDILINMYPSGFWAVYVGFLKEGLWWTINGYTLPDAGYENWRKTPETSKYDVRCGAIDHKGRMDDIDCEEKTAFICERTYLDIHSGFFGGSTMVEAKTKEPNYLLDYWMDTEESSGMESSELGTFAECGTTATGYKLYPTAQACYKLHTDRDTWNNAESTCIGEGGHLAVIRNLEQAEVLKKLYPKGAEHVYVGFSYRKRSDVGKYLDGNTRRRDGEWLTVDGQALRETGYDNWSPGEPNNASGREYCGTIYGNMKFDDTGCYRIFEFICEINPNSL